MKDIEIHPSVILTEKEYHTLLSYKTKLDHLGKYIAKFVKNKDEYKVLLVTKYDGSTSYSACEISLSHLLYDRSKEVIGLERENKELRERNKLLEANIKPWQDAFDYKKQFCQEKADFNELPWYKKMRYNFKI